MGFLDSLKPKKSLSELEEESQRLDAEYTVAQKRMMIAELKKKGLSAKHFNFDFAKIWTWLKTH